jgi:hypothetical protein
LGVRAGHVAPTALGALYITDPALPGWANLGRTSGVWDPAKSIRPVCPSLGQCERAAARLTPFAKLLRRSELVSFGIRFEMSIRAFLEDYVSPLPWLVID